MRRLPHMITALMLALMLWAGGAAQAADQVQASPVSVETIGHFEGDGDEAPADPHQGTAHHHGGCADHHVAAWTRVPVASVDCSASPPGLARRDVNKLGREPDGQLRPPIA